MSRVELAPWVDVLKAVDSVRTPIGLAALTILVLYSLYRTIFANLRLGEVGHRDVARIVSKAMTLLFWLAITAIVIAMLSYVLLKVFDTTEVRLDATLDHLKPGQRAESLSAIESLGRVADRTHKYDPSICEGLAAFVRGNPQWWSEGAFLEDMPSDLQGAASLLSRLNASSRCSHLNLRGARLARLELPKGNLVGADLTNARLDEANLREANLGQANLTGASLVGANLHGVDAVGADFTSANLADADFTCAKLQGAGGLETRHRALDTECGN